METTSRAERRRLIAAVAPHPEVARAERYAWHRTARPNQYPPPPPWRRWIIRSGRRWGKTRTAAQWVKAGIEAGVLEVLAIGPTAADVHDVIVPMLLQVLGDDAVFHRSSEAPSIQWRGATIHLRSGQRLDRCRGLGVGLVWADEVDYWRPEGLKLFDGIVSILEPLCSLPPAQLLFTSTPRRGGVIARLSDLPETTVTVGHTLENEANLAPGVIESMRAAFAGSWLERQELAGELVTDVEGALVTRAVLEAGRVPDAPELVRIVVAIDPSGGGDAQGIVAAGKGVDGHGYVLADRTCQLSPEGWGRRAVELYHQLRADRIVAERNYGGDMVEATLRLVDPHVPIRMVTATRGKHVRFEPVGVLFEQQRLHLVGAFPELEDEITAFTAEGYEGPDSPNRADALVWAVTELFPQAATWEDLYPAPATPGA